VAVVVMPSGVFTSTSEPSASMKVRRVLPVVLLIGVGAVGGYFVGRHDRQDSTDHGRPLRPAQSSPSDDSVLQAAADVPVESVPIAISEPAKPVSREANDDELDPSLFEPAAADAKVIVRRWGKRDLLEKIDRLGIDSSVLKTALYDPSKTAVAQRLVLKYLDDRSALEAELAGEGSDAALRELKRAPKLYPPMTDEMAESLMATMGNPREIWTSEGTFVVDVAALSDRVFMDKQLDIDVRIAERTSTFRAELSSLER
jgi:hypothetical protein